MNPAGYQQPSFHSLSLSLPSHTREISEHWERGWFVSFSVFILLRINELFLSMTVDINCG